MQLKRKIAGEAVNIAGSHTFKFVGAEAFEAAGGVIVRDLFAREEDGYITDVGLLENLASEKIQILAEAENIAVDEWAWVRVIPRVLCYNDTIQYSRLQQEKRDPTEEEAAELARIEAEYSELQEALEQDEDEESLSEAFEALDEQKEKLDAALLVWSEDAKAKAGAILSITGSGDLHVSYGMVKAGEEIDEASDDEESPTRTKEAPAKGLHSEKLVQRLSAHRTAAVRAELIKQPDIALVVLTHRFVSCVFNQRWNNVSTVIKASFESNLM